MNLILDFGNTNSKIAVFNDNNEIVSLVKLPYDTNSVVDAVKKLCNQNLKIQKVIISSVINHSEKIEEILKTHSLIKTIKLEYNTPLPIENLYTSTTIGKDRIAAVVGANYLFPNSNILVIDAGSAITYDFVNEKNQFVGGSISLGLRMRYKALHSFTGHLPMLEPLPDALLTGKNTNDAIRSGIQNGILFEIQKYISSYKDKYKGLKIIFTGGDAVFLTKYISEHILTEQNLVLKGLNIILNYNDK